MGSCPVSSWQRLHWYSSVSSLPRFASPPVTAAIVSGPLSVSRTALLAGAALPRVGALVASRELGPGDPAFGFDSSQPASSPPSKNPHTASERVKPGLGPREPEPQNSRPGRSPSALERNFPTLATHVLTSA